MIANEYLITVETNKLKDFKLNDYVQKIIQLKYDVCRGLFMLGQLLYTVRETKIYEEQFDSFEAFLGDPDISFSRVTAYKAIRVYEIFGLELSLLDKIVDLDFDKLYRISNVINKDNADLWIEKVKTLSRSDLAVEVREAQGLPVLDPARHVSDHIKSFLYEYCPKKKIEPDTLALEELLSKYEQFKRSMR